MNSFLRAILLGLGAAGALSCAVSAQDEPAPFNAFSVSTANGTIVRAAENQLLVVATLTGPLFVETDDGPVPTGQVVCAASARIDQATRKQVGNGACTFTDVDGATAWGEWTCEGYELLGCRGMFKLAGGTGRLTGATGEATVIWRPSAHEFKKQLDGSVLDNVSGVLIWRNFKLRTK